MNSMLAQWEDEENNRQVHFSVDYMIENSRVEIKSVTPNKVSFVCPSSNTATRSVGVHTPKGRQILLGQIQASGQIVRLENEIAARNGELATV